MGAEDLRHIWERVTAKKADYERYGFSRLQDDALKTFFDLAQEFDALEDLYRISVVVPAVYFGLECNLYTRDFGEQALELVCTSKDGCLQAESKRPTLPLPLGCEARARGAMLQVPIRGKRYGDGSDGEEKEGAVLGLLEIVDGARLEQSQRFFFQKYANRVGYALSNKRLSEKNKEHLNFLRSLAADIEHNVIVPNMALKLFLRRIQAKITKNRELEDELRHLVQGPPLEAEQEDRVRFRRLLAELREVNRSLAEEFDNLDSHYRNISLFLESLFRRSHFQEGRFIPHPRPCNFKKEIIEPQLARFRRRFQARDIEVDDQVPDEKVEAVVDVGLISQVYANLFSNALKYTRPAAGEAGGKKVVVCGMELLPDYFGPGKDGIKFNVFSSGPPIPAEEREQIFAEGYRGLQARGEPGTGHGLSFVKNVVEIHGGEVGYEPRADGNNFYFVLPR